MAGPVTLGDRLKRFLYICTEHPKYIVGDAEIRKCYDKENLTILDTVIRDNPETFFAVIRAVDTENIAPHRETIFVALAYAASLRESYARADFRALVYNALLAVCHTDRDLFTFIKFYKRQRPNFPSGLNKTAFRYYMNKDPLQLAQDVTRQKRYYGWSHKDVIKLSHGKTDSACKCLQT